MKKKTIAWIFFVALILVSSKAYTASIMLEELRMEKRFGVGISAGGPLSMFGMEVDFNLTPNISVGGGIGTGLDYSTAMIKARYFLLGRSVSPYFGAGFARWWSAGTLETKFSPQGLTSDFFPNQADFKDGFSVFLFYPVIGVQFMHAMGLSVYAELQYLFKLVTLANGTYAGLGMKWFF